MVGLRLAEAVNYLLPISGWRFGWSLLRLDGMAIYSCQQLRLSMCDGVRLCSFQAMPCVTMVPLVGAGAIIIHLKLPNCIHPRHRDPRNLPSNAPPTPTRASTRLGVTRDLLREGLDGTKCAGDGEGQDRRDDDGAKRRRGYGAGSRATRKLRHAQKTGVGFPCKRHCTVL